MIRAPALPADRAVVRRFVHAGPLLLVLAACAVSPGESPGRASETAPGGAETMCRFDNLEVHGVADIPTELVEDMQRYRNTREAELYGWLGDGVLVATRFGDTTQLHRVDEPLGAREQLTFFDEPVAGARVAANESADGFVYARDTGGSEFYQLFWYDLAGGDSRILTDGHSRYTGVVWGHGGDRFAYTTTERNGRDWDIHIQKRNGQVNAVLEAQGVGWMVEDFAPDDSRLLVSKYVSINESELYELSIADGTLTPLLAEGPGVAVPEARYAPDGRGVFFTSDLGAEFLRLHRLDLTSGRIDVLTADIPWDVEAMAVAPGGDYLAFVINEDGLSQLYVWQLPGGVRVALPPVPRGVISELEFHPEGDRLGFSLSLANAPTDVYSVDLGQRTLIRWTRSETGGLDVRDFVTPELVHFPTFDTVNGEPRQIPAFVYRPDGPGPHAVYVSIHGGPENQYRPYFSAALQYYVKELGMAVVVPNVRGSAGYGKSYLRLDNGTRREDAVRDIGALLDWIGSEGDLDGDRVVVSGGSYGGYMVLASLVHYSDRLAAGVERVGISNFVTFLTHTEDYRRDLRRAEYGDERDPVMRRHLEDISPLNNVDRITRPLLITQGANDPRVPAGESRQIYEALRDNGIPVWYVLALDEGHGFRKKSNSDYAAAATVLFLRQFALRPPESDGVER